MVNQWTHICTVNPEKIRTSVLSNIAWYRKGAINVLFAAGSWVSLVSLSLVWSSAGVEMAARVDLWEYNSHGLGAQTSIPTVICVVFVLLSSAYS